MPVPSQGHYGFHSFRLLADFVCLYSYEFWLSLCKIVPSSVILLLPLFTIQRTFFHNFLLYFPNLFTIFFYIFPIFSVFSSLFPNLFTIRLTYLPYMKWYGKYGKYGRKVFLFYKTINTPWNLFKFTLCPTIKRNNSVTEGITLQ